MFNFKENVLRNGHGLNLSTVLSVLRFNLLQNFFSFRIAPLWDSLPVQLRLTELSDSETNTPFKRALRQYYCSKFDDKFDSDNTCSWISWCR